MVPVADGRDPADMAAPGGWRDLSPDLAKIAERGRKCRRRGRFRLSPEAVPERIDSGMWRGGWRVPGRGPWLLRESADAWLRGYFNQSHMEATR